MTLIVIAFINYGVSDRLDLFQMILHEFKDSLFPKLYKLLKRFFTNNFNKHFKEYIDAHPYIEDSEKYNL